MTDGVVLAAGLAFALVLAVGLGICFFVLKRSLRLQLFAIAAAFDDVLVTPCTAAGATFRALRRIGRARQIIFRRTGPVYSLAASPGCLRLFRGRDSQLVAEFEGADVVDVRVGTTSFGLADYTTLFFGISAGSTTYELPIRVMGPRPTPMYAASTDWAIHRAAAIMSVLNG